MAVNATAIWRVRPSGSNTNGGGYDPGIAGAATDYSQQNAAQATGTTGASTASTTFTDAGGAFTSAMIGNALWLASATGTPTVGAYFITAVGSATSITLDRVSGTYTLAHYAVGGGWADFWTNTASPSSIVAGNTVFILGSGIPNPSSYTFDYTYASGTQFNLANGSSSAGKITLAADPATPSYNGTFNGGVPCIAYAGSMFANISQNKFSLLWIVQNNNSFNNGFVNADNGVGGSVFANCIFDQDGSGITFINNVSVAVLACEMFSSVAPSLGAAGAIAAISGNTALTVSNCNFHDMAFQAIRVTSVVSAIIDTTIIAKNLGTGIYLGVTTSNQVNVAVKNCTIDGNGVNGIEIATQALLLNCTIINNIISNHTVAGKFGIVVDTGTAGPNSLIATFIDYNSFYNNNANYSAINAGSHDTALSSNPYVGQSTENYTLA